VIVREATLPGARLEEQPRETSAKNPRAHRERNRARNRTGLVFTVLFCITATVRQIMPEAGGSLLSVFQALDKEW
jgi:hypothetical protein